MFKQITSAQSWQETVGNKAHGHQDGERGGGAVTSRNLCRVHFHLSPLSLLWFCVCFAFLKVSISVFWFLICMYAPFTFLYNILWIQNLIGSGESFPQFYSLYWLQWNKKCLVITERFFHRVLPLQSQNHLEGGGEIVHYQKEDHATLSWS